MTEIIPYIAMAGSILLLLGIFAYFLGRVIDEFSKAERLYLDECRHDHNPGEKKK